MRTPFSSLVYIFSSAFALLFLIYFFLPLFLVLFIGIVIYLVISYIWAKITGRPYNFNIKIVRGRSFDNSTNNSYYTESRDDTYIDGTVIDSTRVDREKHNK